MRISLLLLLILPLRPLTAQPVSDACRLQIGINLAGPADYGTEWPFVNIMKYTRTWTTHNNQWVSGGQNPWDTDVLDQIPLDPDGYPLSLPVMVPGTEAPQVVRAIWANSDDLPLGRYVILYDGEGQISLWGALSEVSNVPGRVEFDLNHNFDIITMSIMESKAGNHVRNIRVLLPGTEPTYQTEPFSAEWLEKLAPFKSIRFMDWGYTNNSTMREWADRSQTDDYTWTQKSGVPYEWWVTLCNRLQADAWVCVPHAASDDYMVQMATLFRDQLDPNLRIYVEWSNEVWNWIFEQAHYGLNELDQTLPWPERLGPRTAHVLQIWTDVFAGQEHRLIRVMASQHGWWDIGERTFAQIKAEGKDHLVDAISPAAYMGLQGSTLGTWDASVTGQQVLDHAAQFTFNPNEYAMRGWNAYAKLARDNNKRLVFYEGGQHFTPEPFGTEQPYCPALVECQTLPGMYDLYQQLFDTLRTFSEQEMTLMAFSFIAPNGCRYGSWGALQSQFFEQAPYSDAPKYLAILEAIERYNNCKETSGTTPETAATHLRIFPNPTSQSINIEVKTGGIQLVRLYDTLGRLVAEQAMDGNATFVSMATDRLPRGHYTLRTWTDSGTVSRSIVVQ